MQKARDLAEKRMEMKDILIAHDVGRFREFVEKNQEVVNDTAVVEKVLSYDDFMLSEVMHVLKISEPYLGEVFQASRNYFRRKQLHAETAPEFSEDLKKFLISEGKEPLCYQCRYFRQPPPGEDVPCMQMLPQPSMPGDVACPGFTAHGVTDAH
jgi:hypothetical protein